MADAAYKVVGRPHRHISTVSSYAVAPDGTKLEVKQNGPLTTYQVGDVIEDLSAGELAAFPDRFQPATQAEIDAYRERQRQARMVMVAPGMTAEDASEQARLQEQIAQLQQQLDTLVTKAATPVPVEPPGDPAASVAPVQRGTGRSFAGEQGALVPTGAPAQPPPDAGASAEPGTGSTTSASRTAEAEGEGSGQRRRH
jgi:hypothetical protein